MLVSRGTTPGMQWHLLAFMLAQHCRKIHLYVTGLHALHKAVRDTAVSVIRCRNYIHNRSESFRRVWAAGGILKKEVVSKDCGECSAIRRR